MKTSLLLETIITSGLSMVAREHGGVIDTIQKARAITNNAEIIETGLIQLYGIDEIKELAKRAIENRNLSALIDITKEVACNLPGEFLQYSNCIKTMLEAADFTAEPLYLARDGEMIRAGHPNQHLSVGRMLFQLRQTYVSIMNTNLTQDDRLKAVDIFISMLICNPHLQRRVIEMCMTPQVMVNHFDPLVPEARLIRLKHVLTKLATDSIVDLEAEDKPPTVPTLTLVGEDEVPEPVEEKRYATNTGPWLHFTGMAHLVANKLTHGTLQEQLSVFHHLLNTKEESEPVRFRNAVAYVHRSEHQPALCQMLMGTEGLELLNSMPDARLRAELVSSVIHEKIYHPAPTTSIYEHPGRSAPKQPKSHVINTGEIMSFPDELNRLLAEFGVKVTPFDLGSLKGANGAKLKSILEQLSFVKDLHKVATHESATRLESCGVELPTSAPKEPSAKSTQASSADAALQGLFSAVFGIPAKPEEVPELTFNEVHAYQCQVGSALVTLNHTLKDQVCTLSAIAIEGESRMQPLVFTAPTNSVPALWNGIRECLNYHDAYWRIERLLSDEGCIS